MDKVNLSPNSSSIRYYGGGGSGGGGSVVIAHGQLSDMPVADETKSVPVVLDKTFDELKNAGFSIVDIQLGEVGTHFVLLPSYNTISETMGQNVLRYAMCVPVNGQSGSGYFTLMVTPSNCLLSFIIPS